MVVSIYTFSFGKCYEGLKMNDGPISTLYFFGSIGCIVLLIFSGAHFENKRLYQKCLVINGAMQYTDADKLCKEFVK